MQRYADAILDKNGRAVVGASVLVKSISGTPAVIYGANGGATVGNPLSTDSLGQFAFYAPDGRYKLEVSIAGVLYTTVPDIILEDPADESPINANGGTIKNVSMSNVTIDGLPLVSEAELSAVDEKADNALTLATSADNAASAAQEAADAAQQTANIAKQTADALQVIAAPVASAATVNVAAAAGSALHVTGTTTISSLGTGASGLRRLLIFDAALTLTHSSSLILPGSADYTTVAGDALAFVSEGSGAWRCVGVTTPLTAARIPNLDYSKITTGKPTTVAAAGLTDALKTTDLATTAEVQSGSSSAKVVTPAAMQAGKIVLGSAVPTTSGLQIDVAGIPAWAKRVTINFAAVSTSGAADILVQIGSGAIVATGYASSAAYIATTGGTSCTTATNGFNIRDSAASGARYGQMVLSLQSGNLWVQSHWVSDVPNGTVCTGAGGITLAGVLDRLRITTANGTDVFDAGSISVSWE